MIFENFDGTLDFYLLVTSEGNKYDATVDNREDRPAAREKAETTPDSAVLACPRTDLRDRENRAETS